MSYPNPPEAPYPQAPVTEAPARPTRYRGRVPRMLGWIFLAVAIAAFVSGGIVLATKSLGKVNGFQRVPVPTLNGSVTFNSTGKYIAYYEASDVNSNISEVPLVRVALRSPSGQVQQLTTLYGNRSDGKIKILTYNYNGHRGVALYQFTITETGRYRVATEPTPQTAPDAKIAFGRDIATGTIVGALLIVAGVLFIIAAVVLLIIGYIKRARHKGELRAAAFYGAPPPGYGPPPSGYGSPPGYGSSLGYGSPPGYGGGQPGYGSPPGYGGGPPPGYGGGQPGFGSQPPPGYGGGEPGYGGPPPGSGSPSSHGDQQQG